MIPNLARLPEHLEGTLPGGQVLVLRAAREDDGPMVNAAIRESFESLHAWMPWAKVLPALAESEAFAHQAAQRFAAGEEWDFNAMLADDFAARIGLWPLEDGDFEIGYWCRSSMQRRGVVSTGVELLCREAPKYLHPRRLIIRCDSRNVASQNVALKCGFEHVETRVGDGVDNSGATRDMMLLARRNSP